MKAGELKCNYCGEKYEYTHYDVMEGTATCPSCGRSYFFEEKEAMQSVMILLKDLQSRLGKIIGE